MILLEKSLHITVKYGENMGINCRRGGCAYEEHKRIESNGHKASVVLSGNHGMPVFSSSGNSKLLGGLGIHSRAFRTHVIGVPLSDT